MTSIEQRDKILRGLEIAFEKLLEFKKQKNSVLVIMRGDEIIKVKPEELSSQNKNSI